MSCIFNQRLVVVLPVRERNDGEIKPGLNV